MRGDGVHDSRPAADVDTQFGCCWAKSGNGLPRSRAEFIDGKILGANLRAQSKVISTRQNQEAISQHPAGAWLCAYKADIARGAFDKQGTVIARRQFNLLGIWGTPATILSNIQLTAIRRL